MRGSLPFTLAALVVASVQPHASDATRQVTLAAQLESKTSLRVSATTLVFDVPEGGVATVSIEYNAAARTRPDAEIVLSVAPTSVVEARVGAADVEARLTFAAGAGQGRRLDSTDPVPAERWTGSGIRRGRLTFTLEAPVAGTYVVPVRLLLSAP